MTAVTPAGLTAGPPDPPNAPYGVLPTREHNINNLKPYDRWMASLFQGTLEWTDFRGQSKLAESGIRNGLWIQMTLWLKRGVNSFLVLTSMNEPSSVVSDQMNTPKAMIHFLL